MSAEKATVFNIQRFCTDDGPGIRTTVFLKGCPLRCLWCHNPEGLESHPCVEYDKNRCKNCLLCSRVCENGCHFSEGGAHVFVSSGCSFCGECIDACPYGALSACGRELTPQEVMSIVEKDAMFYSDSGGVTLSGGEPLIEPDFSAALLFLAKEKGFNACVETSGYAQAQALTEVARFTDLFLFDIKETDEALHVKYTSVEPKRIFENLELLCSLGKRIRLRCPIIPGLNDRKDHFRALNRLRKLLPNPDPDSDGGIQIMPYHRLGTGKSERFGINRRAKGAAGGVYKSPGEGAAGGTAIFEVPSKEQIELWNRLVRD